MTQPKFNYIQRKSGDGVEGGEGEEGEEREGGKVKTETGRGKVCDPGDPGGGKVKQEPMETDSNDTDSLNR